METETKGGAIMQLAGIGTGSADRTAGRRPAVRVAGAWWMLVVVTIAMLILPAQPARATSEDLTTTEVSFTGSGDVRLHGSIVAPTAVGARLPGIVMVHGSGPGKREDRQSVALAPLAWYESPWLQLGAVVLLPMAFLSYPLTGAVRRLCRHGGAVPARVPARWLAATGLASVVGFVGYFGFLLVTAANLIGPVVCGRPVPWLILQLLAVATVAATGATAVAWWRDHTALPVGSPVRLGLLLAAGVLFVPWAAYWGLLIP